jgi:hypothetical protein
LKIEGDPEGDREGVACGRDVSEQGQGVEGKRGKLGMM